MKLCETSRLVIRRWQSDDASDLYDLMTSDIFETLAVYGWKKISALENAKEIVKCWSNQKPYDSCPSNKIQHAIFAKQESKVIGTFGIADIENDEIEVGYIINSNYSCNGYATESLVAMIEYLKGKCKKITTRTKENNIASIKVMEKAGMSFEKNAIYDGVPHVVYAIKC